MRKNQKIATLNKFAGSKPQLLKTHYCQKPNVLVKSVSQFPLFKQGKQ